MGKYKPFPVIKLENRQWPNRTITKAPIWCSVCLRDGNQALAVPMTVSQKLEMFDLLIKCGFKEIEVGFPAASPTEFEFVRRLIEGSRIPEDVTIQVLVQAREDLIKRTVESLVGVKKVIIHLYNSTSPAQRRIVFGLEKPEIIAMAVQGTKWVKEYSSALQGTEVILQYSPESFSATEIEFSLEVCEAVMDTWEPTPGNKMILNLPCTVEVTTPNVYADQIEWFCRHMTRRDSVIISLHTHNDRGTGIAATELGMLAGADRVEGTLFGNGERTGNLDIITVALNLYAEGIDPGLDFSNLESIREVYERCTQMTVPPRHPYSGELVFTAFSGSHQDAIRKGLRVQAENNSSGVWEVPYLFIDPRDIGRRYDEVIRVNGQSGKGGIAYLLENECGIHLPKDMQREFGSIAGKAIDALGSEVTSSDLRKMLWNEYINRCAPYALENFIPLTHAGGCSTTSVVRFGDERFNLNGEGNGPIDAFVHSFRSADIVNVKVLDQSEHSLGQGSEASAIAYIRLQFPSGNIRWGAGVDTNIEIASIKAVVSALNRE
ncbi:MAG: 2-isopropylmalate synthase [Candidatus Paceibacterota bacterium]